MLSYRPHLMPLSLCVHIAPFWPFHKTKPTVCNGGLPDLTKTKVLHISLDFQSFVYFVLARCLYCDFFLCRIYYLLLFYPASLIIRGPGQPIFLFLFWSVFLSTGISCVLCCPCSLCPKAQPQDI